LRPIIINLFIYNLHISIQHKGQLTLYFFSLLAMPPC